MAALHEALKALGPTDFSETPIDDLNPFLSSAFSAGQLIVDSVPIAAPTEDLATEGRSRAVSNASSASEIEVSPARSEPPPADVLALQKEWKGVKLAPRDNPLGMSVYKLGAKDGKGAWFARRSVHEGLGFEKWKRALEKEFPETMKGGSAPGEGNIRGIGGERRVEYKNVEGVGKMEVYQLSAQFPGPTTPRDFVTMFLTSDQALSDQSGGENDVPRHFMVISKPCTHPDTAPRDGYIRGQYESVEFIREIPLRKGPRKSFSSPNLPSQGHTRNRSSTLGKEAIVRNALKNSTSNMSESNTDGSDNEPAPEGRVRGKTISYDKSKSDLGGEITNHGANEEDDGMENPVEWIMITRSDPGGSVPRFMVERGTPAGIVSDASKFLNWACAKDIDDFDSDDDIASADGQNETVLKHHVHDHENDLHNFQTNGHLAGLEEEPPNSANLGSDQSQTKEATANGEGYYSMAVGAAGAASAFVASHTPAIISGKRPDPETTRPETLTSRRDSLSSMSSESSFRSFASALETAEDDPFGELSPETRAETIKHKELQKLEEKKRKLDDKLRKARDKDGNKKSEDSVKEDETVRKAEERHEREVKKQEEKYKRELEKLTRKKEKEERKNEERKRKAADKDERTRIMRELDEVKAEVGVLRKEKEILRSQVGDLQAENTALAAKVGRLGAPGEGVLREVREEVAKSGRSRASSLKGLTKSMSIRSGTSSDKEKDKGHLRVPS